MSDSVLDYAKVTGRFALTSGDGDDSGDNPDIVYCDEGTVEFTPLVTFTKVAGGSPVPFEAGNSVIVAQISAADYVDPTVPGEDRTNARDGAGHITYRGKPFVMLVDLTSDKVNPAILDDKATHSVAFKNVKAAGTAVTFPARTVRVTADGPNDDGVNELVQLLPVVTGSSTPIVIGPRGTSVGDVSINGLGELVVDLTDGTTVNAGELPVGPGGSDAGVGGYMATPGSDTQDETRTFIASEIATAGSEILDELLAAFMQKTVIHVEDHGMSENATAAENTAGMASVHAAVRVNMEEGRGAVVEFGSGKVYDVEKGNVWSLPDGSGALTVRGNDAQLRLVAAPPAGYYPILRIWPDSHSLVAGETAPEDYLHDIVMQDLRLLDTDSEAHRGVEETHGFGFQYIRNLNVFNCRAEGFGDEPYEVDFCEDFKIHDNHAVNCQNLLYKALGGDGANISIKNGCKRGKVYANTILTSPGAGAKGIQVKIIQAADVEDIEIFGNIIDGVAFAGLWINTSAAAARGIKFHHNTVRNCPRGVGNAGSFPLVDCTWEELWISGSSIFGAKIDPQAGSKGNRYLGGTMTDFTDYALGLSLSGGAAFWSEVVSPSMREIPRHAIDVAGDDLVVSGGASKAQLRNVNTSSNDEIQTLTIKGVPTGGTWKTSFTGSATTQTTTDLAYNASAAAVKAALEALSNIGGLGTPGTVTVTKTATLDNSGNVITIYRVTFQGGLAKTNVAQLVPDGALLTGGTAPTVEPATLAAGVANSAAILGVSGSRLRIKDVVLVGTGPRGIQNIDYVHNCDVSGHTGDRAVQTFQEIDGGNIQGSVAGSKNGSIITARTTIDTTSSALAASVNAIEVPAASTSARIMANVRVPAGRRNVNEAVGADYTQVIGADLGGVAPTLTGAHSTWEGVPASTTTALAAIGNAINTTAKYGGKRIFNSTTGVIVRAAGSTAGDMWVNDATGLAAHTPV